MQMNAEKATPAACAGEDGYIVVKKSDLLTLALEVLMVAQNGPSNRDFREAAVRWNAVLTAMANRPQSSEHRTPEELDCEMVADNRS